MCWIDLGTPNPAATQAFYSALFGWTITESDSSGYWLCTLHGKALGSAAVALDPVGAPVSLWQPGRHIGMDLVGEFGTFAGVSLLTDDVSGAADFHQSALHWTTDFVARIGPPPGMPTTQRSLWLVEFASDSPESDAERAQQLGAAYVSGSTGRVILRDPTGALFALTKQQP